MRARLVIVLVAVSASLLAGAGRASGDNRPRRDHLSPGSACRVFDRRSRASDHKGAVIRTASFARTLYTICTCTLPCIDPR
jgi:hypothetical protein